MKRRIGRIFAFAFLCLMFSTATSAYAVIPQLLGPLSALVGIIGPILGFLAAAILTVWMFARDAFRMLIFRVQEFISRHKVVVSLLAIAIVGGISWLTYQVVKPSDLPITTTNKKAPLITQSGAMKLDKTGHLSSSWSTFRGGMTRTGHLDNLPGPTAGNPIWIFKETNAVAVDFSSSPAVVGDRLYVGSAQGSIFSSGGAVYCLDATNGEVIWRYSVPVQIFSSPTVAGGRVYVGEGFHQDVDCHLRCLDANSGQEIWSFPTASHVESTPSVSQGKVYFGAGTDGVYCVDALEGKEIWHYPSIHVDISPLISDGKVFFGTGYGEYQIFSLDANTGKEIWSKPVAYPVWGSPSIHEDTVFFGLGNGNFIESADEPKGRVIAVNVKTGEPIWRYESEDAVLTAVAYRDGLVYFGSRDGNVYVLKADTGELHWKASIGHPVVSSPAITEKMVYFGANNGIIYGVDLSSGETQWSFDTDEITGGLQIYSSPAIANEKLYVGSTDRYIFCLGKKDDISIEDR